MKRLLAVMALVVFLVNSMAPDCRAADASESDLTQTPAQGSPDDVATTVNGEPIKISAVDEAVRAVLQGRPLNPASQSQVRAEVLSQLIDRALILQMLTKKGKAVPSTEIMQAVELLKQQAAEKKMDYLKSLKERGLTEEHFHSQLAWQLNWAKYLQTAITDAAVKTYFDAHKREFDGTELQVSHILLQPDGISSTAETDRLKRIAEKLREQIEAGKITFEDAAKKISAGPSRRKGGDLGFIPRRGVMTEQFADAAFKLEKGKISEPVATPFGVHLIKWTEEKPGRKSWIDVKDQIRNPLIQDIFEKQAAAERKKAKIEFTDKCPHYKPGTKELVEP